ncbi:hypothetical protein KL918_003641 [Ogataea parapolymorpha]|uniref:Secreted protein n=1 Tax=Ogataea parapolymorpha (strain ATCC 26012 / BCRC 20466 / JCM 22074 / NRRL Y-7560 / DL-1) TaxID=871575 RepID=W1QJS1_OGAPD|nr:putative secreted protein [Ogataea parapolymorpha DL-1]ESX02098.1 putative secreted protein [Ogataea parapolymorpha DL-1]KAG7866176.1 hypothetical protein KL918_003641 [Ogataea parapolymorpha]KAG7871309.1 hypothetical protein KL916_004104 [Ogataea parapolymorpha]
MLSRVRPLAPTVKQSAATLARIDPVYYTDHVRYHAGLDPANEQTHDLCELYTAFGKLTHQAALPRQTKVHYYNELIRTFARFDFGVYACIQPHLAQINGKLEPSTLKEVLLANPGRRWSTYEIFEQHCTSDPEVKHIVLERLVDGEKADTEPEDIEISFFKAYNILKLAADSFADLGEDSQKRLVTDFFALELDSYIASLPLDVDVRKQLLELPNLTPKQRLSLLTLDLPNPVLIENLVPIAGAGKLQTSENEKLMHEKLGFLPLLDPEKSAWKLISVLEPLPQAAAAIAKARGFFLEKSQTVPTDPLAANLDELNFLISAHETVRTGAAPVFVETASPQIACAKILLHAWTGSQDEALDEYNAAIAKWGAETQTSSQLVYCLVLATLLQNDVQLAQYIRKRAVDAGLVTKNMDRRIADTMKAYGDLVEEKKDVRQGLQNEALSTLVHLAETVETV